MGYIDRFPACGKLDIRHIEMPEMLFYSHFSIANAYIQLRRIANPVYFKIRHNRKSGTKTQRHFYPNVGLKVAIWTKTDEFLSKCGVKTTDLDENALLFQK